jgi:hypothetical protein
MMTDTAVALVRVFNYGPELGLIRAALRARAERAYSEADRAEFEELYKRIGGEAEIAPYSASSLAPPAANVSLDGFLPDGFHSETEIECRLAWHAAWATYERWLASLRTGHTIDCPALDPFAHLLGDYGSCTCGKAARQ